MQTSHCLSYRSLQERREGLEALKPPGGGGEEEEGGGGKE